MPPIRDKDEEFPDQPLPRTAEGAAPSHRNVPKEGNILRIEEHRNKEKRGSSDPFHQLGKIHSKSGDQMSDSPSREEIAARLEAMEARSDTKFAQFLGEMRTGFAVIDTRLNSLERSTAGTKMTIIGTGIGAVAVIVAVLAYGQTWFGIGVSNRDTIKAIVTEVIQQQTPMRSK